MKELEIISTNSEYIKKIESFLISKEGVLLIAKNDNKLGVVFEDNVKISQIMYKPLKKCLMLYKKEYYMKKNLLLTRKTLSKFIQLNLSREYNICFGKVKFLDKIYLDSVFNFLTKEITYSWDNIAEIIKETICISKTKRNVIKFKGKKKK